MHYKNLFNIVAFSLFLINIVFVLSVKDDKSGQTVLNSAQVIADTYYPQGDFRNSCKTCSMIASNNPATTSTLTCQCFNGQGNLEPASYLQNAWGCNFCIANINGALSCILPSSASFNGYQSRCSACGLSAGSLFCLTCDGKTPTLPYSLPNACECDSVAFINDVLVCMTKPTAAPSPGPTPEPTLEPTLQPTPIPTSTKSPTPNAAPATCESYWLTLSATGENAPFRPCSDFLNVNGCQHRNYCCWQPTSSQSPNTIGVCIVPNGVPVECTQLNEASCIARNTYCFWNANYGTEGLCQRRCPGNPETMCRLG